MGELPKELELALGYSTNYVEDWSVEGSRVELSFSQRREPWPWRTLPPWHPVVVDKIQYFGAITGVWASGGFGTAARTALTRVSWSSLARDAGPAHRGTYQPFGDDDGVGYTLDVFDASGRETLRIRGEGVAFGDRDFGAWRSTAKEKVAAAALAPPSELAEPEAAGLGPTGHSLISPLREEGGTPTATGWVTSADGFTPSHPFHTGSGDHVNAGHLLDCALEGAHLLLGTPGPLYCSGGEARFRRFVELDVPFEIALGAEEPVGTTTPVRAQMQQGGRETTGVRLDLVP